MTHDETANTAVVSLRRITTRDTETTIFLHKRGQGVEVLW